MKQIILWGFILWLIGYLLGIILFFFVPAELLGWVIMPIGIIIATWIAWKKLHGTGMGYYLQTGIIWAVIALVADYLFLVLVLHPADGYYKLDVYLYYLLTFLIPVLVGGEKKEMANNYATNIKFMKNGSTNKFVTAIIISELAGVIGSLFTVPAISGWYATLNKPELNPPAWIFGPVWITLYFLIGISLYLVWIHDWKVRYPLLTNSRKPWNPWSRRLWLGNLQKVNIIGVFTVQYILNIVWSLVFFGWHSPQMAFFVILALWVSIIYTAVNFYRVSKVAAWLLLPYILWVSFAAYLNYAIWYLNLI